MQKKKNVPAFLRNTFEMLEREELNEIVGWAQTGNGFVIKNLQKFSQQILPQYFKHKKYTSFVRQLNMYGFHKQRHHFNNYNYFAHQHFRKGNLQSKIDDAKMLLAAIKRKPQKKKKTSEAGQSVPENNQSQESQTNKLQEQLENSSSPEVSVVLDNSNNNKQKKLNNQNSSSNQIDKQNNEGWSQESSQFVDQITEKVMQQNEILRNLHQRIRAQVLQSKKRAIERLSRNEATTIQIEQSTSISQLTALLIEGTNLLRQLTENTI